MKLNITFMKAIVVFIIIVIIYIYLESRSNDVIYVVSALNNKRYLVRNLPDKQEAADLLAEISLNLERMVEFLKITPPEEIYKKFKVKKGKEGKEGKDGKAGKAIDREKLELLNTDIRRLVGNFNPNNFTESTPDAKTTSYSVNKGEKVVFCLRSKRVEQQLVRKNTMMFVAIHELAHLMTKSVGHEPDFWDNFKFLLVIGIHLKTYKHVNFNRNPEEYCGTEITDTPLKL